MRIIGGDKKGFKLRLVAKKSRPTLAKVREAIFNILGPEVVGANVLDLFCGSGALGIEALSRGAKSATFIDRDTRSLITNIKEINFKNVVIIKSDVFRAVKKLPQQNFDIIFLDPPYQKNLLNRAIISILDLLTKSGIIVVEHHKREAMIVPSGYYLFKEKRYGDSLVGFLKRL